VTLIEPPPRDPLTGHESFIGLDGTVDDFRRFALPDLLMNNARGWFVEYLVWRALGVERPERIEWDAFDVLWGSVRIEVKASAQMQQWAQAGPSTLKFEGLRSKTLIPGTNSYTEEASYNADVYVLAAHAASSHDAYDQLDLSQWRFVVLTRTAVAATGYKSISWFTARALGDGDVGFDGLAESIRQAAATELGDG
jgi:hypothetical protein